jgi:capsular exopolysaccharide synthesis family protein
MSEAKAAIKPSDPGAHSMLSKVQRYSWTFRKWWWILLICGGLGISWAAWKDSKKSPSYLSIARMMVNGRVAIPEGMTFSEELSNFYGTQSRLMESDQVRQRAAALVENKSPELVACPVSVSATPEKGTSFFVLTAVGSEPKYTQALLDAVMKEYIRYKQEKRAELIDTMQIAITDQLLKGDRDVDAGQEELLEFKKTYNVAALDEEQNSAARHMAQANERLAALKQESKLLNNLSVEQNIERKQQGVTGSSAGDGGDGNAPPSGAEAEYLKAKQQVEELKAEKARRSRVMRPKHPLMVQIDADISRQEGLIQLFYDQSAAQMANKREAIRKEIETLEASAKELSDRTLELTGRLAKYDRLKGKVEQSMAMQRGLNGSSTRVTVDKNLQPELISIMDLASPSETTKPGLFKDLAVGALSGVIVGLAIIFLISMLDDRITSSIELRERFPEPLLGHIPHEGSSKGVRVSMLSVDNKQGVFAEAYRNLRSTLHFMSLEEPRPKAFLVTSAVPGEGKSTVAVNLAIILAGGGSRTLLIDADIRKGLLNSYFSVKSSPGLVEVLSKVIDWRDAIVETGVKNLSLIPRGKGGIGPGELFLSEAADEFLREIYAAGYDRIVFDSAPVLATDDTACLAPKIDATLFVVRSEASSMRLTRSALDALHKRQVNVLGLILNAANLRSAEYHYYQKYGDYYAEAPTAQEN